MQASGLQHRRLGLWLENNSFCWIFFLLTFYFGHTPHVETYKV